MPPLGAEWRSGAGGSGGSPPGKQRGGSSPRADTAGPDAEYAARRLAGQITLTLQAALLVRHAPAAVADAFCASRLGTGEGAGPGGPGVPFGTLPDGVPVGEILDRARLVPR